MSLKKWSSSIFKLLTVKRLHFDKIKLSEGLSQDTYLLYDFFKLSTVQFFFQLHMVVLLKKTRLQKMS